MSIGQQQPLIASSSNPHCGQREDQEKVPDTLFDLEQFAALCIVSEVKLQKAVGETIISAQKSSYEKCQRCWNYWPTVGTNAGHPDLCKRCIEVISG